MNESTAYWAIGLYLIALFLMGIWAFSKSAPLKTKKLLECPKTGEKEKTYGHT